MVRKGEIIEVPFTFPDGKVLPHPAVVVSDIIDDAKGDFFYAILISTKNINPQYTIEIKQEMLTKALGEQSYFVTHIMDKFMERDIMQRNCSFVKTDCFEQLMIKVFNSIFGLELELE